MRKKAKPRPKYRSLHASFYAMNPAKSNKKPSLDVYDRMKRERGDKAHV